jgi:hypothetical protein
MSTNVDGAVEVLAEVGFNSVTSSRVLAKWHPDRGSDKGFGGRPLPISPASSSEFMKAGNSIRPFASKATTFLASF